jgi:hypothetical protein
VKRPTAMIRSSVILLPEKQRLIKEEYRINLAGIARL